MKRRCRTIARAPGTVTAPRHGATRGSVPAAAFAGSRLLVFQAALRARLVRLWVCEAAGIAVRARCGLSLDLPIAGMILILFGLHVLAVEPPLIAVARLVAIAEHHVFGEDIIGQLR